MSDQKQRKVKQSDIFVEYDVRDCFRLPNPSVRGYFNRVVQGQSDLYTTPWVKGETVNQKLFNFREIVSEWDAHLESLAKQWPTLYAYEKDQMAKVGPMSVMKPFSERIPDIESYYTGILLPATPIPQEAIDLTCSEFAPSRGLISRSMLKTWEKMKKSTSSGTPYFIKKRDLGLNEIYPLDPYVKEGKGVVSYRLKDRRWPTTAILGWRGQEGGSELEDTKQRVVWMFPTVVNVAELSVYQPLIEGFQKHELVPAWVSMDLVDQRITQLFDTKAPDDLVICTDFTKFDQHFNPQCQKVAAQILEYLFKGDPKISRWLVETFPIKYNIPLLCTESLKSVGAHGMGSGSGGTNADETLLHRTLQHEAAWRNHQTLNPNSMCLGDDGILSYPNCSVEDVTEVYQSHGLDMNLDKQYASAQDCTYLRRWHHRDYRVDGVCVGVYSTMRALGRLCMQERYYDPEVWGPKMVALRELSILENCKWHPLKEEFVKFCMSRDKYRLGLDIPRFLDDIESIAKEATDYMPDFLGYTKSLNKNAESGIGSWWIVRYLKKLRERELPAAQRKRKPWYYSKKST